VTARDFIERRLTPLALRLGEQRHLQAVRDGVVGTLPLVLLGSLFLLLAQPPLPALQAWLEQHPALMRQLLLPFVLTTGAVAVFACFGVAASLARSYRLDATSCGILAVGAFFVAVHPLKLAPAPGETPAWMVPLPQLGTGGLFIGIAIAFLAVELQRLLLARRWTIRMPEGVPPAVSRSFASLLPAAVLIVLVWTLFHLAGLDLFGLLGRALGPVRELVGNNLAGILLVVALDSALWLLGIHAVALLAVLHPLWLDMLLANAAAHAAGQPLPHMAPREFYIWFVWLGGSGAALLVPWVLVRARSAALRTVGKVALLPALCNINEPLIFGVPVVMNPLLAIPFLAAPLACALTAWLAFHCHLVARPYLAVPWTLPAPVGAFLCTGSDWRALVLVAFNLALATLVWLPFLRRYDRTMLKQQAGE